MTVFNISQQSVNINLWQLYRGCPVLCPRLTGHSPLSSLDILHVVSRIETNPAVLPSLAPALLILVLELLELLAWNAVMSSVSCHQSGSSLLTSFEAKFVRFSCLVVVESPDRLTRLAVVCQHVLAVIFVKLLVIKRIGILRAVAETF